MNKLIRMARFITPYRWRLFFFFFTAVGFSLFSSLPILIIRQFLEILIRAGEVKPGESAAEAEILKRAAENAADFWFYAGLLVAVEVVRAYFVVRREVAQWYLSQIAVRDATNRVAAHVLQRPLAFFDRWRSGELIDRITRDSTALVYTIRIFTTFIREPLTMIAVLGVLFSMNPLLTLISLAGLPIAALPVVLLSKRIRNASRREREVHADRADVMLQVFSGVRVVKGFGREDVETASFRTKNDGILQHAMKRGRAAANMKGILEIVGATAAVGAFVAGFMMIRRDLTTPSELLTFIIALGLFGGPLKSMGNANSLVQDALPGAERLFSLLDIDDKLEESPGAQSARRPERSITLTDVAFSYGREQVLSGVDIEIQAGKVTAIVGPSGSGKSTVLNLVARFYDPTRGGVAVDGTDLKGIKLDEWLGQLGLVTQDPFLFNTSIRDNIRYGRPDATDEEVEGAARVANIHDDIVGFEGGYDAIAGERGSQLSGGQRQRICLARALIRDPAVLLLDEATSSLDSAAERVVQEAIERAQAGRTSIVVAHRLSTIRNADRIYVMVDGAIEASGTHDVLLSSSRTYEHLWRIQQGARDVS